MAPDRWGRWGPPVSERGEWRWAGSFLSAGWVVGLGPVRLDFFFFLFCFSVFLLILILFDPILFNKILYNKYLNREEVQDTLEQ